MCDDSQHTLRGPCWLTPHTSPLAPLSQGIQPLGAKEIHLTAGHFEAPRLQLLSQDDKFTVKFVTENRNRIGKMRGVCKA